MKKIATFLIMVLLGVSAMYAETIPLKPKDPPGIGTGDRFDRSELIVPTATIENGVINLETAMSTWGVNVTIYNGDGVVMYNAVSAEESMQHSFAVGTLSADDYIIEVQIGEDYYEGEFSIN